MSPGDYARAGDGLEIAWGWFDSPFGPAIAMGTDRGLCGLGFAAEMARGRHRRPRPPLAEAARFTEAPERLRGWVEAAFGRHPAMAVRGCT
jgi:AraC family transcriptional regulator, regulatory protein of adaptative response / methylated-DNA-[protein]-cysteine methyltransferase